MEFHTSWGQVSLGRRPNELPINYTNSSIRLKINHIANANRWCPRSTFVTGQARVGVKAGARNERAKQA